MELSRVCKQNTIHISTYYLFIVLLKLEWSLKCQKYVPKMCSTDEVQIGKPISLDWLGAIGK